MVDILEHHCYGDRVKMISDVALTTGRHSVFVTKKTQGDLMKILIVFVSLLAFLFVQDTGFHSPQRVSIGSDTALQKRPPEDLRRQDFAKARGLLVTQRVPFDPEILLTPDWELILI